MFGRLSGFDSGMFLFSIDAPLAELRHAFLLNVYQWIQVLELAESFKYIVHNLWVQIAGTWEQ